MAFACYSEICLLFHGIAFHRWETMFSIAALTFYLMDITSSIDRILFISHQQQTSEETRPQGMGKSFHILGEKADTQNHQLSRCPRSMPRKGSIKFQAMLMSENMSEALDHCLSSVLYWL